MAGLDVGSTTAKIAVVDENDNFKLVHSEYKRHKARVYETIDSLLENAKKKLGDRSIGLVITGSAGMGISERADIPFVQEIVASTGLIKKKYPAVKTLIDIGGEDSKMIFFADDKVPDIRMNGNCAGGTGAFIEQMAALLNISLPGFNDLAVKHKAIYPIASRCGVFAKTDVQNLLSCKIPSEDIAASVFHAVTLQGLNTLARGFDIKTPVMFSGGPFTFFSELTEIFLKALGLTKKETIKPDRPELLSAIGAAVVDGDYPAASFSRWQERLEKAKNAKSSSNGRLAPLFAMEEEYRRWEAERVKTRVPLVPLKDYRGDGCYLGIDSGSTTTKIAVIGEDKELLFQYYVGNKGQAIEAATEGLRLFKKELEKQGKKLRVSRSAVTGYGEDLIKATFGIDSGCVETIAHYTAAKYFNKDVSFILDIGGQDMKAIFIENGIINRIELNEACSSGCGSFIEVFGNSLGYKVDRFASFACEAGALCELGTRCTVFMNSKVKQHLRENASVGDIAAGLSFSVIKNALFKVLKLTDMGELGDNIVVQGGTFKNRSIHRAIEQLTGKKVICSNIPEQMGAYGAALIARREYLKNESAHHQTASQPKTANLNKSFAVGQGRPAARAADEGPFARQKDASLNKSFAGVQGAVFQKRPLVAEGKTTFIGLDRLDRTDDYTQDQHRCKGCENNCLITKFKFPNNRDKVFYSGNKCEKIFSNRGAEREKGFNFFAYKYDLLFKNREAPPPTGEQKKAAEPILTLGIPRVLNMYENFPFWRTLLNECNIAVEISSPSTMQLCEKGLGTVMSDCICFPAKLAHGHIMDLIEKKIDRIFFPMVFFENAEHDDAQNYFNCPVVSGYPEVIKSAINPAGKYGVPLDSPTIAFNDKLLLERSCYKYLRSFGVKKSIFKKAFQKALNKQKEFKLQVRAKAAEVIKKAKEEDRLLIVFAGRPYHADPLINHKTPEILAGLGVDMVTEDAVQELENQLSDLQVLTQWSYPNRIYSAAKWAGDQPANIQFVQFNSFGCGPDAIAIDETNDILKERGKNNTVIRIDEIVSTGSVRLRLRSLIESLKQKDKEKPPVKKPRFTTPDFKDEDQGRTILAPHFSHIYSPLLPPLFKAGGYKLEILPKPDKKSVELGLKYANNEICYPATVIVGDMIKALQSGKYKREEIAIGITQTGGQCRASAYLSLIKKAMVNAGFGDVPVVAVGSDVGPINEQPGFKLDWRKILPTILVSILYTDSIARMYYSTAPREVRKGGAKALLDRYTAESEPAMASKDIQGLLKLLEKAVVDFNGLKTKKEACPRIGIVGEIYVKYNSFGHFHVVDWLVSQGVEVVIPPILDFFTQWFVNAKANKKTYLSRRKLSDILIYLFEPLVNRYIRKVDRVNSRFTFYQPFEDINDLAKKGEKILSLAHQFGEGWLIPAGIAAFSHEGVNNAVSLQPFGCISNHIISKGVEKKIKDLFPHMNLLFLDFDDCTSEVNVLNRLYFMVKNASEKLPD